MTKNLTLKTLALSLSMMLLAPFANVSYAAEASTGPEIVSKAAIVMDYETGEIIYEKNANDQMFLASTTKLMTALLFAENKTKTDKITYTATALAQPPYTVNSDQMLPYGKSMKVGDTLDGDTVMKELLLFSGNDMAYMIADSLGGDSTKFAAMMNAKAKELGLNNTHFETPNGLPINNIDVNYSTAYELGILAKTAYENDWIRETIQLSEADVVLPGDTRIKITNRNTELNKNGNIGGKTGITDQAGTCFAGVYEINGRKLIGVVLKSDLYDNNKRFEDLSLMMNYSEALERETFKAANEEVESTELEYKLFKFFGPVKKITVPVVLAEDAKLYNNAINNEEGTIALSNTTTDAWKAASDNNVTLTLSVKDFKTDVKGTVNITTSQIMQENAGIYIAVVAAIIIVLILLMFIVKLLGSLSRGSKSNKRRKY